MPSNPSYPGELAFRGEVAQGYDGWFETPQGRYAECLENELITELVRVSPGQAILDVGCGTANQMLLFSSHGAKVYGADVSWDMLKIAQGKLKGKGKLLLARGESLPLRTGSFSRVTLITSLELMGDPIAGVREALRVGRGEIFLAVLNRLSLSALMRRIRAQFKGSVFRNVRFLSLWDLRRILHQAIPRGERFHLLYRSTLFLFPFWAKGWFKPLDRFLTRLGSPFGAFLALRVRVLK